MSNWSRSQTAASLACGRASPGGVEAADAEGRPASRTQAELAARLGVSRQTVFRVLNNHPGVGRATRDRVLHAVRQSGYRPSAAARSLRDAGQTGMIGVLLHNTPGRVPSHRLAYELLTGVADHAEERGVVVCVVHASDIDESDPARSRVFRERLLDGLIVGNAVPARAEREAQRLWPFCVLADSREHHATRSVTRDETGAGRNIGLAMARLGYRRLVYLGRPAMIDGEQILFAERRLDGLREAAREAGVELVERTTELNITPSALMPHLDVLRRDACVVAGDLYVAEVLSQVAASLGLSAPYDYGLACCDDSRYTAIRWPGLTRARFDRYAMGQAAARMLLDLIVDPRAEAGSLLFESPVIAGNTAWGPNPPPRLGVVGG